MPANQEVRNAAARLRRAVEVKRIELHDLQREIGNIKDDSRRRVQELEQEIADIERQVSAEGNESSLMDKLQQARAEMMNVQNDSPRLIAEKERAIQDTESIINDLLQKAADLEGQAGNL